MQLRFSCELGAQREISLLPTMCSCANCVSWVTWDTNFLPTID